MSDKEKDYFIPEQLEDNDFEKERQEQKQLKKSQKNNKQISDDEEASVKTVNKKKILNVLAVILIIAFIIFEIVWYVIYGKLWTFAPKSKKTTEPEQLAEDFCEYFNDENWKKINESMDFKGYYVLGSVLQDDAYYPNFDKEYEKLDENDEEFASYLKTVEILKNIDEEILDDVAKIKIDLKSIDSCNKIQGTDTLYRLRVTFDYIYNGETQSVTNIIFISNASGEYKMVYGEWMQTVLSYYQSIYLQTNYSY